MLSTDAGSSWRACTPIPDYIRTLKLTYGRIMTAYGGIIRYSDDDGVTWSEATWSSGHGSVTDISCYRSPSRMLAATYDVSGNCPVWRSTDLGATWSKSDTGISEDVDGHSLAASRNHSTVYLGSSQGLWKSTNDGASWAPVVLSDSLVVPLCTDAADPNRLYAANDDALFRTTDGGTTWTKLHIWTDPYDYSTRNCVLTSPSSGKVWYRNTVSADAGQTWKSLGPGLPCDQCYGNVVVSRTDPQQVFYSGYQTTNGGASWWPTAPRGALRVHPDNSNLWFVNYSPGLWVSTDAGANWQPHTAPNTVVSPVMAIDPKNEQTAYIPSWNLLYKTTDQGQTWWQLGLSVSGPIEDIGVCSQHPETMFVTGSFGCYRSTDGGQSWAPKNDTLWNPSFWSILIDPDQDSRIYMGGWNRSGFFRSDDYGEHWLDFSAPRVGAVYGIACPFRSDPVYVVGYDSVYRTSDGGAKWVRIGLGLPGSWLGGLAVVGSGPWTLYAAADGGVVWKCIDAGGGVDAPAEVSNLPRSPATVVTGRIVAFDGPGRIFDEQGRAVAMLYDGANRVILPRAGVYVLVSKNHRLKILSIR